MARRQLNNNNIVDEEGRYSKELAFQTAYSARCQCYTTFLYFTDVWAKIECLTQRNN